MKQTDEKGNPLTHWCGLEEAKKRLEKYCERMVDDVPKQERSYKEDMEKAFNVGFNVGYNDETSPSFLTFEKWFKQFNQQIKMKNIHILPTDKPSKLFSAEGKLFNYYKPQEGDGVKIINKDIFITNSEEIKEGDYGLVVNEILSYNKMIELWGVTQGCKIILTTDQDLIKDGVQAIDDEFLEWFVKNPSCDEVEVLRCPIEGLYTIISKEEPTQECECTDECLGYLTKECKRIEEPKQELEMLEVPMPIENKIKSTWNKSNTTPNFDGEYLCYISCREECGNVHRYYKVVSCSFNVWIINENERIALWKELEENPFASQKRSYSEEEVLE